MTRSLPPPLPHAASAIKAPPHLKAPERDMWAGIVTAYTFEDEASLSLLRAALEAHQRARLCREAIDRDGLTFVDRFGQLRSHPLLTSENASRLAFVQAMKALNLDTAA